MPHFIEDRVRETTSTTGTGAFATTGAVAGHVTFASKLTTNGDTAWYAAQNSDEWEVGLCTRTSATTYARTTVLSSSNADALVSFTTAPQLFLTIPAAALAKREIRVQDQKTSGTAGDTFTSGAYQASVLNTVVKNTLPGASLASNQVTLAAGTYRVRATVAANGVAQRAALYDVTNAAYLLTGLNNSGGGPGNGPYAFVEGDITLAGAVALELRLQVKSTGAGLAMSFGDPEVYADLHIERLY